MLLVVGVALNLFAQGTTFFYQGRLNDNASPATGHYDLRFALFDAATNGNAISVPQTNFAVPVSGGMFTTNINFGAVFSGTNYWLSIGVRTNGNTNGFTLLQPLQPILPTPYAIFANTASNLIGVLSATQLVGTLPSAQLSGNFFGAVTFTNATNNFFGKYFGNGVGLTNLNATMLSTGTVADARLSTNVALLNTNQIFSGINQFTSVSNIFTGNFFGNGLVGWIPVSLTATQAIRDAGYMCLNPGLTTVTLPPTASLLIGDIVRVSAAGAGGWLAKVNAGQSLRGNLASYGNSFPMAAPKTGDYRSVAVSADGVRLYAVGNAVTGVSASSDSGHTWSSVGGLAGFWQSVACSANGKIVFAVPSGGGTIQMSLDSGSSWQATAFSGTTVACTANGNQIFTANIACSGNGTNLGRISGGVISVSTNGGTTWVVIPGPVASVSCLGVSSDCSRLVAGVNNGFLYASANLGATWTTINTTNLFWSGAYMTGDGSKFAAAASTSGGVTGGVYFYGVNALPNTVSTNSIGGSQDSAVELQYIGNNQFMPIGGMGTLWAN